MMNDDPTPARPTGAAIIHAAVDVECPQCHVEISAGERVVQALGIPGLYCTSCGAAALDLATGTAAAPHEEEDEGDGEGLDLFESLRLEYEMCRILGRPAAPALLVLENDVGPVWRVGVIEDDGTDAVGCGRLNGDRLEVTLYQPFLPAGTG